LRNGTPERCNVINAAFALRAIHHMATWHRLAASRHGAPDSAFVFATERGGPFTPDAINRLIKRIGERARFAFAIHAHMLRHACGYALAYAGHDTRRIQDWLGH
jgi:site-specific recombinase XerD